MAKSFLKVKNATVMWLGVSAVVLSLVYLALSMGNNDLFVWAFAVTGAVLATILLIEGGFATWIASSGRKSFDLKAVIALVTFFLAGVLVLNSVFAFGAVAGMFPDVVVDWTGNNAFWTVPLAIVATIGLLVTD